MGNAWMRPLQSLLLFQIIPVGLDLLAVRCNLLATCEKDTAPLSFLVTEGASPFFFFSHILEKAAGKSLPLSPAGRRPLGSSKDFHTTTQLHTLGWFEGTTLHFCLQRELWDCLVLTKNGGAASLEVWDVLEKSFRTWGGLSTYHHRDPAMNCAHDRGTYLKVGAPGLETGESDRKLTPFGSQLLQGEERCPGMVCPQSLDGNQGIPNGTLPS